jgi:hypothetical protein
MYRQSDAASSSTRSLRSGCFNLAILRGNPPQKEPQMPLLKNYKKQPKFPMVYRNFAGPAVVAIEMSNEWTTC